MADREHRAGRLAAAAEAYGQILRLQPDLAEAHNNLGNVLRDQGRLDDALVHFQTAARLKPTLLAAHNNQGNILKRQRKLDEAAAAYQIALALDGNLAEVHNNLGAVQREQGKFQQALAHLEKALALKPNYPEPHLNLGNLLRDHGRLEDARTWYQRALDLRPDYAEAQLSLGMIYLLEGDFERGWPAYEARLRLPEVRLRPNLPRWTGQPLADRTLLLLAEQGLGDVFQFIRFARLFKQRGARVVLACKSLCRPLLTGQADIDEVVLTDSPGELPRCDFYLPLLSAPALATSVSTIPRDVPYLRADPQLSDQWRRELSAVEGFQIGICWQGSRQYVFDRWRSFPLAQFAALARQPGVRLVSLQKGFGSEQIATVGFPVLDLSAPRRNDWTVHGHGGRDRQRRSGDHRRYGDRPSGGSVGRAGFSGPRIGGRLALDARPGRFPLVSDDAALPATNAGPMARRFPADRPGRDRAPLGQGLKPGHST